MKINVESIKKADMLIKLARVKDEIKRIEEKLLELKIAAYLNKDYSDNVEDLILRLKELNNITLA